MGIRVCYVNHHFATVAYPKPVNCFQNRKSLVQLHSLGSRKCSRLASLFSQNYIEKHKFLVRAAASSPPLGGSGAEYSEQLQGARPPEKRKRIGNVDQEEIEAPTLLADPDSCFCEFNGVQLHHKIYDAELPSSDVVEEPTSKSSTATKRIKFPMILLHGFGASVFSWNQVMKPLARITSSKVLAFDRPAFGLTSRVNVVKHPSPGNQDLRPLNPYSMLFSVLATLHFIDFLAAEKAILVGHSAGALVAVDAYFDAPDRVAALILVAPAILAPFTSQKIVKENKTEVDNQIQGNSSDSSNSRNFLSRLFGILSKVTKYIVDAISNMAKGMANMVNSLYKKVLSAILQSTVGLMAIRMIIDKFGIPAIRTAWFDSKLVSDHVIQGYTKPLRMKGWDKALIEFTVAMLADSSTTNQKQALDKRLREISCPVLVVTGDTDRLVPSWNSERLSRDIPGSSFEVIKNCGHLPQEEKPEEFVSIIEKFLQTVFGVTEEPCIQTAT